MPSENSYSNAWEMATPGQPYVHSIVCTVRVLIYSISKSQLALAQSQGLSAEQLAQNNNAPGPHLNGQPVVQNMSTSCKNSGSQLPTPPVRRCCTCRPRSNDPNISNSHLSLGFFSANSGIVVTRCAPPLLRISVRIWHMHLARPRHCSSSSRPTNREPQHAQSLKRAKVRRHVSLSTR